MKKLVMIACLLMFVSGCGSLKITPRSCNTKAVWGSNPASSRTSTREEMDDEKILDIKAKDEFYVFSDREIRIRDILESHGIKCEEVKKLRVEIKTSWFFKREVSLKVVKN
ncbi:MAG: hypothetical protein H7177_15445 [Rhizobacter sp.]|nr:hypothetical protein [Bacteriovorax sp.]